MMIYTRLIFLFRQVEIIIYLHLEADIIFLFRAITLNQHLIEESTLKAEWFCCLVSNASKYSILIGTIVAELVSPAYENFIVDACIVGVGIHRGMIQRDVHVQSVTETILVIGITFRFTLGIMGFNKALFQSYSVA